MPRVFNFSAGPAALPLPVLERVQSELLDLQGGGASILEISHRSKLFESIIGDAEARVRALLGLGDHFHVLFLQGGATQQFSMVPMNLLAGGQKADYIVNGIWAKKALQEAKKVGLPSVAASTESDNFSRVPRQDELQLDPHAQYVHFTSNETIYGIQHPTEPETGGVPLVADASSDILSRPIDVERYGLIYAGAQKNIGPAGATLVIVRDDLAARPVPDDLAVMLAYRTHVKGKSLYNTPNTFGVYVIGLVCEWIQKLGGLAAMQQLNEQKSGLIYNVIDGSGFYRGHAQPDSRSAMNVTFRLPDEDLEKRFVREAAEAGMTDLKGHRDVGGIRASLYNAMPLEGAQALASFMREFETKNS